MVPTTHWLRLTITLLALVVLLPSLASSSAAQDDEKVLHVQQLYYPDVVDPQRSGYTNELAIIALAYEGLTRIDTDQETIPAAAEAWEYTADATGITFHLRDGLAYSDGSPLTAERFRYAIERTCDPATAGSYQAILFVVVGCADLAGLTMDEVGNPREYTEEEYDAAKAALGVRVVDDLTLQIDFTQPTPYFHTIAATWVLYPTRQESVEADPDTWWQTAANHIGNGPFTVSRIDPDQQWTFAANEHYWQGRPLLDGITYVYVADPAVALAAYRSGDLDIIGLGPSIAGEVRADPVLARQILEYPIAGTQFLAMSNTREPFTDPKVRQAFAYAFDRETFCDEIQEGTCVPALSWIPSGVPGAIETDQYAFDPEKARQALAESTYGGPEGLPDITLTYLNDDPTEVERAEWLAGQYRDILGVELTLNPIDGTTNLAMVQDAATFPQLMTYLGWIQDYPDPQNWLSVYWTCDSAFAQPIGYCNPEFDRLIDVADTSADPDERRRAYEEAGQLLLDDLPVPFVFHPAGVVLVQPNVTGITPTASDFEWPGQYSSLMTIDKT